MNPKHWPGGGAELLARQLPSRVGIELPAPRRRGRLDVVAAKDIDELVKLLRRLGPAEIAKVRDILEQLPIEPPKGHPSFGAFSGVLSKEDADLMSEAENDCEHVDAASW